MTWLLFLGVYVGSYTAGLAANLPGGLGVFDTAHAVRAGAFLHAPRIVGAIVVFRLYYYVIPLFLAGRLFAANEMLLRGGALMIGRRGPTAQALGRWSEPDFAVAAGTGAVALSRHAAAGLGVLSPRPDFSWLDPDYADFAIQAGQFVPSLIGAGLVVLAIGLSHRVNLAWGADDPAAGRRRRLRRGAGRATLDRRRPGAHHAADAPFRGCFYRHARLLSGPLEASTALSLLSLVVCVLALGGFRQHVRACRTTPGGRWCCRQMPNSVRASVGLTVVLALVAVWLLVRPGRVTWHPWDDEARLRLARLGTLPPTGADGVVWGEAERAGIAFRRFGRVLLALGDPAGAEGDRVSAIWRLRDLAQQEGLDPAVWRAGPELLKVYGDLG